MQRYFFDYVEKDRSLFDYKGREFSTLQGARLQAELIALDMGFDGGTDWAGWQIAIRNVHGERLLSIPMQRSELLEA